MAKFYCHFNKQVGHINSQIPRVSIVKLEPIEDNVYVLFDSNDEICLAVIISYTSSFPIRNITPTPSKVLVDVDKTPFSPLYMRLVYHGTPSQRPPLHPCVLSSSLNIVEVLKLIKSRKRS